MTLTVIALALFALALLVATRRVLLGVVLGAVGVLLMPIPHWLITLVHFR